MNRFLMIFVDLLPLGYVLCEVILLKINATANRSKQPVRTGDKT